jgi:coenzyme PQQ synthesis protein D (PqqD)
VSGSPEVLVRRSHRALWRRVQDEALATTSSDADVHRLVGGAAEVWEELAVPGSLDELAGRLAGRFDVPLRDLRPQVTTCVDELMALGLVEQIEGADA